MSTLGGRSGCFSSFVCGPEYGRFSNGRKRSASMNGRVSIDATGRTVNVHDVSSLPTGLIAQTV